MKTDNSPFSSLRGGWLNHKSNVKSDKHFTVVATETETMWFRLHCTSKEVCVCTDYCETGTNRWRKVANMKTVVTERRRVIHWRETIKRWGYIGEFGEEAKEGDIKKNNKSQREWGEWEKRIGYWGWREKEERNEGYEWEGEQWDGKRREGKAPSRSCVALVGEWLCEVHMWPEPPWKTREKSGRERECVCGSCSGQDCNRMLKVLMYTVMG